eukprot:766853-Hanusia_phi.AAC.3
MPSTLEHLTRARTRAAANRTRPCDIFSDQEGDNKKDSCGGTSSRITRKDGGDRNGKRLPSWEEVEEGKEGGEERREWREGEKGRDGEERRDGTGEGREGGERAREGVDGGVNKTFAVKGLHERFI